MKDKKNYRRETELCHDGGEYFDHEGAIVPPIFQNSLFAFEDWDAISAAFDRPESAAIYTRGVNPTVRLVEEKLARLAGGEKARLFASGMGAISAAILHGIRQGGHIVSAQQIYGPANNFMHDYLAEKCGVEISYTDGSAEGYRQAIRENTSLFYLESPGSLKFPVQDIRAIARLAREHGITTVIDNTWATPLFQRTLDMGIDLEVHSCSKYLGGHSDIVAGVIIGAQRHLDQIQMREQAWLGAKMAPIEAWLLLRSLRTLPARMARHMESGLEVARFLESHPQVQQVYHPGLESFPGYDLAKSQMQGYGSLLSFELRTRDAGQIKRFANGLRLFKMGVSWGGHESLIYAPLISYEREQSPDQLAAMGISPGLIRISVGLENPRDLIEDLDQALALIKG